MRIAIEQLPDDPVVLKRVIGEQREQLLAERNALIERIRQEAAQQIEALRQQMEAEHKAVMAALLRRYYGPKSERFDPRQLLLFGQRVEALPLDEASIAEEAGEPLVTRRVKRRDRHGRQ